MKIEFKARDLKEALKACADSVMEQQDRILSCICVVVKEAMVEFQATDGNRMVIRRLVPLRQEGDTVEGRYIIACEELYKYIKDSGKIEIDVTEDAFTVNGVPFRKEDDDLTYPKVEQLISNYGSEYIGYNKNSANTFSIRLNRKYLISILKNMKSNDKDMDSVLLKFDISNENTGNKPCYILNGEYNDRVIQGALIMPISKSY